MLFMPTNRLSGIKSVFVNNYKFMNIIFLQLYIKRLNINYKLTEHFSFAYNVMVNEVKVLGLMKSHDKVYAIILKNNEAIHVLLIISLTIPIHLLHFY